MKDSSYTQVFVAQKVHVVSFLCNVFFVGTLLGWLVSLVLFVQSGLNTATILNFIISSITVGFVAFLQFKLLKHSYKWTFFLLSTMLLILSNYIFLVSGTANPIALLLLFITIVSTAIVMDIRKTLIFTFVSISMILFILFLHWAGIVHPSISTTASSPVSTLVIVILIGIIINVVRVGYSEVENSYMQARKYATELEKLNSNLDQQVQIRTQELVESYKRQSESVYNAAVMGMVTRPMLHDISTPLSSLSGMFELLEVKDQKQQKIVDMGKQATDQLVRIVQNGRELMQGKPQIQEFSPANLVDTALSVLRHELEKHKISVETNITPEARIVGAGTAFERIVLNLILNAMEELTAKFPGKPRYIWIEGKVNKDHFVLEIKDNGRGVPADLKQRIFEKNDSHKTPSQHFGMGLPFVKDTIINLFNGSIALETKENEYTKFILHFSLHNEHTANSSTESS